MTTSAGHAGATSSKPKSISRAVALSAVAGGVLAGALALAITLYMYGRTNPLQATRTWLVTFVALFLALAVVQVRQSLRVAGLPPTAQLALLRGHDRIRWGLAAGAAVVDSGFYLSDYLNHGFMNAWPLKFLLAVVLAGLLIAALEGPGAIVLSARAGGSVREALASTLRGHAPLAVPLVLACIGLLAGTSYVTAVGDDYARYWTIADALSSGLGYPASQVSREYTSGGMATYLVDLPGLPLAMMASFALMGHTVLAAMVPALLGAALFPLAAYLAVRELTGETALSLVAAVTLTLFPPFVFYALRAAEPDPLFVTLLATLAFLAIRCDSKRSGYRWWIALGAVAGAAALTRPEGIMYAGVTYLTLFLSCRRAGGFWVSGLLCGAMVGSFSAVMLAVFGEPWPSSFAGTVAPGNIARNLHGFWVSALPGYSEGLGLPVAATLSLLLAGSGFFLMGSVSLGRHRPRLLFLALLPVLNLISFLLVDPALTRPQFPYDFFRRASYLFPFFVITAAFGMAGALDGIRGSSRANRSRLLLAAAVIVVIGYEVKLGSAPEITFPLGTNILTSGRYLLATDLAENRFEMPRMPFERDGKALLVAGSFDYMAFRGDMDRSFKPLDLHGMTRATGYGSTTLALFLVGLLYALAGRRKERGP